MYTSKLMIQVESTKDIVYKNKYTRVNQSL